MKRKMRLVYFNILMIVTIFGLANISPKNESLLKDIREISGNAVNVEFEAGCLHNFFADDTILKIVEPRLDPMKDSTIVVIRGDAEYYLLGVRNGKAYNAYGDKFQFRKDDRVCYEYQDYPEFIKEQLK